MTFLLILYLVSIPVCFIGAVDHQMNGWYSRLLLGDCVWIAVISLVPVVNTVLATSFLSNMVRSWGIWKIVVWMKRP